MDLDRFLKSDYQQLNTTTVEKYHLWSRRYKDQLNEHCLDHLLYPIYIDMYAYIISIYANYDLFNDQPALSKKYQYLFGKIADPKI